MTRKPPTLTRVIWAERVAIVLFVAALVLGIFNLASYITQYKVYIFATSAMVLAFSWRVRYLDYNWLLTRMELRDTQELLKKHYKGEVR